MACACAGPKTQPRGVDISSVNVTEFDSGNPLAIPATDPSDCPAGSTPKPQPCPNTKGRTFCPSAPRLGSDGRTQCEDPPKACPPCPLEAAGGPKPKPYGEQIWELIYTAPTLANGMTLLGELEKMVPVSSVRFADVDDSAKDSLSVSLLGAAGEEVEVGYLAKGSKSVAQKSCTMSAEGKCTLMLK